MLRIWRKFKRDKWGLVALLVVLIYLVIAVGVSLNFWGARWEDLFTPQSYASPTREYWFGTNFNGQDIFSRCLYSTKTAFEVGIVVAFLAPIFGTLLGSLAGYYRASLLDSAIVWLYGCIDSIPFYLFVAAIAVTLRDSNCAMYVAMVATMWTGTAKVVRAQVMHLKQSEFIEAARSLGSGDAALLYRHIFPNTLPLVLVEMSLAFVSAIKTEALLSFLGLGIRNGVSWGLMLAEASSEVGSGHYSNFTAASVFLFGLVMSLSQVSDALQDALDPKTAGPQG